jgi:hypothetical protein
MPIRCQPGEVNELVRWSCKPVAPTAEVRVSPSLTRAFAYPRLTGSASAVVSGTARTPIVYPDQPKGDR